MDITELHSATLSSGDKGISYTTETPIASQTRHFERNGDLSTVSADGGILIFMSKVKSPSEKKRISLVRDHRNVYGECPTSSRKNISRGKQRGHMEVRRGANEELRALKGESVEADVDVIESRAKDRILALARSSFKKVPDAPLGVVVARKVKRRAHHATGRKSR